MRKSSTTKPGQRTAALEERLVNARAAVRVLSKELEAAEQRFRAAAARGDDEAIAAAQRDREETTRAVERAEAKLAAIEAEMPKAQKVDAEQMAADTEKRLGELRQDGETATAALREAIDAASAAVDDLAAAVEASVQTRIACARSVAGRTRTPHGGTTVTPGLAESLRKLAGRVDYAQSRITSGAMNASAIEREANPRPVHPSYDPTRAA